MSSHGASQHGASRQGSSSSGHGQKSGNPAHGHATDTAPGDESASGHEVAKGLTGYFMGLVFAVALTLASFLLPETNLVWGPSLGMALVVFAIAQMGVHLVFFLHITTGPDNTNNVMALAFGVLIVFLLIAGSLWIMGHVNENMLPMDQIMNMQR